MITEPLTEAFWNDSIVRFSAAFEGRELSDPELYETAGNLIGSLADSVLVDLIGESGVKVPVDARVTGLARYLGANLTVQSGPVLPHLRFGVYVNYWFLDTLLPYVDSLPNVTESFWEDVSAICQTAPTTFNENEVLPRRTVEQKRLMQSGRSVQYKMVRNYVLKRSCGESDNDDIGSLESRISLFEPFDVALPKLRALFRLYHRVLNQLYQPAHRKERAQERRWSDRRHSDDRSEI